MGTTQTGAHRDLPLPEHYELTGEEGGLWRLRTYSGAIYTLNLDDMTLARRAGGSGNVLVGDEEVQSLKAVLVCRLAESAWFLTERGGATVERGTTPLAAIERIDCD